MKTTFSSRIAVIATIGLMHWGCADAPPTQSQAPEGEIEVAAAPQPATTEKPAPDAAVAALVPQPEIGAIAAGRADVPVAQEAQGRSDEPPALPRGWSGSGVLEKSAVKLPRRAPRWARVAVEVTVRGGERFLVATGSAKGIKNPALARANAEARARAAMARWLGQTTLVASQPVAHWSNKRLTLARVEMPLAADVLTGQAKP